MTSLPSLSSNDGITVVAALLGHARQTPHQSSNVRALDDIFDEIVNSLRDAVPLRQHIQVGAAAVSALFDAIHSNPNTQSSHLLEHLHQQSQHSKLSPSNTHTIYATPTLPLDDSSVRIDNNALPSSTEIPSASTTKRPRPNLPSTDLTTQQQSTLPRQPPRKKRYHDAAPSTHCHVCCRPKTVVPVAVCSNIKEGTCRKVVCRRCITSNGWDWDIANDEKALWICPHCTDSCATVSRAQCWVYMRTNSRRRMRIMQNKKQKAAQEAVTPTYSTPSEDPRTQIQMNPQTQNNNYAMPITPITAHTDMQVHKSPSMPLSTTMDYATSAPQASSIPPVTGIMNHSSTGLITGTPNQQLLTHSDPTTDQIRTSMPMKNVKGNINHVVHP